MQLGTRWSVGDAVPERLSPAVATAVARVERELAEQGVDASTWRWTLTWLEGKPVVERDDGTSITVDQDGTAHVTDPEDAAEED